LHAAHRLVGEHPLQYANTKKLVLLGGKGVEELCVPGHLQNGRLSKLLEIFRKDKARY
jgi:hypothetical protein